MIPLRSTTLVCTLVVALCLPHLVLAQNHKPLKSINPLMQKVGVAMSRLYPLIVAQRRLKDAELGLIRTELDNLQRLFEQARPFIERKPDNYQITYEFARDYLKTLRILFQQGDVESGRRHLFALGEICSSCHTQDKALRSVFRDVPRQRFESDLAYAEFSYMTREYEQAIKYYRRFLDSGKAMSEWDLIQPLQRLVLIYLQVLDQPKQLQSVLLRYRKLKQHTGQTKKELLNWLEGLEHLAQLKPETVVGFNGIMLKVAAILGPAEAPQYNSSGTEEITRLWLRGRIYAYLNAFPQRKEIPVLLYWLSVADRSVAVNFYFSLSNMYLKQCVIKYPAHPYAQRCYREYEYMVENTYTVQGEKIPPGLRQELLEMKESLRNSL